MRSIKMKKAFACLAVLCLLITMTAALAPRSVAADDNITIVLDPGHGGRDGGASGSVHNEDWYNLRVAEYCKAALEAAGGFTVYMTRYDASTRLTIGQRAIIANSHNADFVLSIHFDSSVSRAAHGSSAFESVLPEYRRGGLAANIIQNLVASTPIATNGVFQKKDTGDSQGVYYWSYEYGWDIPNAPGAGPVSDYYGIITWSAKFGIPAVIVEHAYISNASDAAAMNDDASLRAMGEADAQALIAYYTNHTHTYTSEMTRDFRTNCCFAGKKSYKCTVCGHRKDVTMLSQSPDPTACLLISEGSSGATCTSAGWTTSYCRIAHNLIDKAEYTGCTEHRVTTYSEALGHTYSVISKTEKTHLADGVTTYKCTRCGSQYSEYDYAEGHILQFVDSTEPDCVNQGVSRSVCTVCGEYSYSYTPALGHTNETVTYTAPTCTVDGSAGYHCTVCGADTSEVLPSPGGHSYVSEAVVEATCTISGETRFTCSVCGDSYTESSAPAGHSYVIIREIAPDCENAGVRLSRCSVCGDEVTESIAAPGHQWGEGITAVAASVFSDGSEHYICKVCNAEKSEVIPRVGIDFVAIIIWAIPAAAIMMAAVTLIMIRRRRVGDDETEAFPALITDAAYADASVMAQAVTKDGVADGEKAKV